MRVHTHADGGRAGGGGKLTAVSECVMKSSNIKFNGLSLGGMGVSVIHLCVRLGHVEQSIKTYKLL